MKTALLCWIGFALTSWIAKASERPPNIIVILTDDQGYGDVGVFGAQGFTTPNLDRLAAEGRIFTNFHVSQPVCSASRAALLTGCYSNRIGINGALSPTAKHGISSAEMTLAELVKQQGYVTGMAGKWHLGHAEPFLPIHHGFDEYFGLPYSNDMWPRHPGVKAGTYPDLPLIEGDKILKQSLEPEDQEKLTTQYTERAVRFIERNKDRPFFFYLAHSMPHVPLHVSSQFKGKSSLGLYGDVMMELDWSVGQIIDALERNGLRKGTLIFFTSDNGPWLSYGDHAGSAGPLREGKGTAWEGGTRVPCIMSWPEKIPAGTTCSDLWMTIDLFPVIARLTGAKLPNHQIDGLDVWPLVAGESGARNPHSAYATYYEDNQLQAVTSGDGHWKLQLPHEYRSLNGSSGGKGGLPAKYQNIKLERPQLFDLKADLGEKQDLAQEQPEVVARLLELGQGFRADLGDSLSKVEGIGRRSAGKLQ